MIEYVRRGIESLVSQQCRQNTSLKPHARLQKGLHEVPEYMPLTPPL